MSHTLFAITLFLSAGLSLFATEPSLKKTEQPNLKIKENQSQMAGWMIESSIAAKNYIEKVDRGEYVQSWLKGDQIFQQTISKEEWIKTLNIVRKSFGKVISRKIKNQSIARNIKGLPKGAYMIVEYATSFERSPFSTELLTLRQGSDTKWRVLTYHVF